MIRSRLTRVFCTAGIALLASTALANERDQAHRMYSRLAATPPTADMLDTLESLISGGQPEQAARLATEQDGFYNVTLKNMVTPWTNEAGDVFAPLNDYTATVIGIVRDDADFRQILHGDILYVSDAPGLPGPSASNNDHYAQLEQRHLSLRDTLQASSQSAVYGLQSPATAGVMTTRAAAKAYFVAGTNRAMLRFTLMHHLCNDLEQLKDLTRPADRIRQDISRSPGGDSRIYLNSCIGCHNGMDPLAQAFAYYDWSGEEGTDAGELIYTPGTVRPKYLINANNFPHGFVTEDDRWDNYWREGPNANLGWGAGSGSGSGAKSMGQELANSRAFASCQAQKVFRTVCLRTPHSPADVSQIENMTDSFTSNNYQLRELFIDAAVYCRGD